MRGGALLNPEKNLIRKAKQGDKSALDELLGLYYAEIYKYCCWHTKSPEEAEDATQETFYKAVRFMGAYKNTGTFKAYLYKIALNICIDRNRKKTNSEVSVGDIADTELSYIERGYDNIESEIDLGKLLEPLTEKQREMVILKYSENLTLKEIAAVTGSNLRTCQSNLRKALKNIEKNMRGGF